MIHSAYSLMPLTSLPCKISQEHQNYQRIEKAIAYLIEHQQQQPSLNDLANHIGLSEYYLQKLFSQWAGLSPKQFLQFLTKQHAKHKLQQHSVLDSAHAVGLSGSSRLHDLFINIEAVTPGEYKTAGQGLDIYYGIHSSPLGYCLLALSDRGICQLAFFDTQSQQQALIEELQQQWDCANITQNSEKTSAIFNQIFTSEQTSASQEQNHIKLLLKGSPFQIQVWQALLNIPAGDLCSYTDIAEAINKPNAVRAVASAIANNHIGYLIPCHRVIRSSGVLNNYRWGVNRKTALLAREEGLR